MIVASYHFLICLEKKAQLTALAWNFRQFDWILNELGQFVKKMKKKAKNKQGRYRLLDAPGARFREGNQNANGRTDGHTDIRTYGRTDPLIEMRRRI